MAAERDCANTEQLETIKDRLHSGELRFKDVESNQTAIMKTLEEVHSTIMDTHRRMFVDNGTKSIQTIIDRHDRVIRVLTWSGGITVAACVSAVVKSFF